MEAARTLKCDITRWTLPKNGKRYKTMCLICGSDDVRLASRDKVLLQEYNLCLFCLFKVLIFEFETVKIREIYEYFFREGDIGLFVTLVPKVL